jgi:hypothetical protein
MRIRVGIMVVRSNEIGAFGASNFSTLALRRREARQFECFPEFGNSRVLVTWAGRIMMGLIVPRHLPDTWFRVRKLHDHCLLLLHGGAPRSRCFSGTAAPETAPTPPPISAPATTPTGPPIKPMVAPVPAPVAAPPVVRSDAVWPHPARQPTNSINAVALRIDKPVPREASRFASSLVQFRDGRERPKRARSLFNRLYWRLIHQEHPDSLARTSRVRGHRNGDRLATDDPPPFKSDEVTFALRALPL